MAAVPAKTKKKGKHYSDYVLNVPKEITNIHTDEKFKQLGEIGAGAFGKCFLVQSQKTEDLFVCKVFTKILFRDTSLKEMVQNEVDIQRTLRHENVVQLVSHFENDNFSFVMLEACLNTSLSQLLEERGKITINEVRFFVSHLLSGLDYIHSNKIIHRDIKPANLLLDLNMKTKIADFGLAVRCDDSISKRKSFCGTTPYMAPEIIELNGFDMKSDIWAVGVTAYSLVFGKLPFYDRNKLKNYSLILSAMYEIPSGTDVDFESLLKKVLEKDVNKRLDAKGCIKDQFFTSHEIPDAMPEEIFSKAYDEIIH